jgi:hypothetical protein
MNTLRQPGRGKYDSERQLARWLASDGHSDTTADPEPGTGAAGGLRAPSTPSYGVSQYLPSGAACWSEVLGVAGGCSWKATETTPGALVH